MLKISDLQTFFKKNAKKFVYVVKKQYLCIRFRPKTSRKQKKRPLKD